MGAVEPLAQDVAVHRLRQVLPALRQQLPQTGGGDIHHMGVLHHRHLRTEGLLQIRLLPGKALLLRVPGAAEGRHTDKAQDLLRLTPVLQGQEHIRSHQQPQLILRVLPAQGAEGIRRVALPPPLHLHVQHLCRAGQLRRGQRGHLQTLGGIGAALRQCLMRRDAGGDQQQKVQPQLLRRCLCRRDMAPVNGVKGPAVNTDLHITRSSSGP